MAKEKRILLKFLYQRFPIVQWAPKYNTSNLTSDIIAGITVGLTVMPQSLAYATLGGLEPQYGLYSAFMGCFIYAIFGGCKDITIGPTALMALMTYQQIANRSVDYAVLLCFICGLVQLFMAVLNLGVLVDFISIPVTVGFTSATSVIIAASQLKGLFGLKYTSSGFIDTVSKTFQNIHNTRYPDLLLGIICIIILLLLRKLKEFKFYGNDEKPTKTQKYLSKFIWLFATSRNALVVIFSSLAAFLYETKGSGSPFLLTGNVKAGLPPFKLPPFETSFNNQTVEFSGMLSDLGASMILVPVISVLGNVAIAKAFASGQQIDATQELLTLSLCNIFGSFFSSMPVTGSFSRSAVNHASGVQTPLGGVFTGIMVLLALSFLTPYFSFIPKTSLAAVIICAVIFMIEYEVVKPMWRSNKKDLIPTFATFLLCLIVGVELGILIGVSINLIFLLYPSARPKCTVDILRSPTGNEYILITPGYSLYFPSIDFIKSNIAKQAFNSPHLPVVLDCRFVQNIDFTAAKGIANLIKEFSLRNQRILFLNPSEEFILVYRGVIHKDFQYISSNEELQNVLEDNGPSENDNLLTNGVTIELKEILSGNHENSDKK
ncbi:sodium-independent sulfate anion transporter-like [Onthophagus taurus]|uniref:sodium-independent sulfate anion transporter-like n=1 Tax=Onthophagus taurus TaxID=166361 RepID=UPI0039BE94B8